MEQLAGQNKVKGKFFPCI